MPATDRRAESLAGLGVFVSAALWGVYWLPLRAIDDLGLPGKWATLSVFACAALLLLPIPLLRWRRLRAAGLGLAVTGVASGGAWVLYSDSLLLTDVVRAILLFYLTPIWSTILGCLLLGERIVRRRLLALALGFSGMYAMLGMETGLPLPRNTGDWIGLAAGLCWAYASVRLRSRAGVGVWESNFAFFAGGAAVAAAIALIPFESSPVAPSAAVLATTAPWAALLAGAFVVPATFLIVSGAARLSPARVGILLMAELVVGAISAALLTDEPFGLSETLGVALIGGASLLEIFGGQGAAERS